ALAGRVGCSRWPGARRPGWRLLSLLAEGVLLTAGSARRASGGARNLGSLRRERTGIGLSAVSAQARAPEFLSGQVPAMVRYAGRSRSWCQERARQVQGITRQT